MSHRTICPTAALLLLSLTAGCGTLGGAVADKLFTTSTVKAQYVPERRPLLVLAEPRESSVIGQEGADRVAAMVEHHLTQHDVCPVIPAAKLMQLRTADPARYQAMSPGDKAAATAAQQILQIDLRQLDIVPVIGGTTNFIVTARVRVVDATGKLLWPAMLDGTTITSTVSEPAADLVYEQLSMKIAVLFYDTDK